MAISKSKFINKFLDELKENTQSLENGIISLKKNPDDSEEINNLLRALHTIKGSSRMMNFPNLEKIAHALENIIKGLKEKRFLINNNLVQWIFISGDILRIIGNQIKETEEDEFQHTEKIVEICEKICANEPYNFDEIKIELDAIKNQKQMMIPAEKTLETEKVSISNQGRGNEPQPRVDGSTLGDSTIRIEVNQIDTIIQLANTLSIKQLHLRKNYDMINTIEEMSQELIGLYSQNPKEYQIKAKEFLKEIKKSKMDFLENAGEIESNVIDLQENIVNLRMLPIEIILGSLPKMVEETAISLSKDIDLKISKMNIKLDKVILEKINDPILHLLRNSIDHGIEPPEEREKKGKPGKGTIEINCFSEGGHIIIQLKDDGRGFDYDKIRQKAIENFPMQEEEIKNCKDSDLIRFLFMPNFSTKDNVTELSGRGIGLDIVKLNIEKVKGKILLESEKDKGTCFTLVLPHSLATIDGLLVLSAGKKFLIPSNFIKETFLINQDDKVNINNREMFRLRENLIPLYDLSSLLQLPMEEEESSDFVIVIGGIRDNIGIKVNLILGYYDALVSKPLPKNLQKLNYLQGVVFDENFNLISILHITSLIDKFNSLKDIDIKKRVVERKHEDKTILVVDDSINTLEIEKSMLELEDYKVLTASDGIEGLERLRQQNVDLIITDINMPRMDGFTFIENLKKITDYRNIPIIIVSTYNNEEYKQKGRPLGVEGYIIKSSFDQNNLISTVQKLIGKAR